MKTKIFTLLLAMMASVGMMRAEIIYNVTFDNLNYKVDTDAKTAEVQSASSSAYGDIVVPASIIYDEQTYSVTSIGAGAFYEVSRVTGVSIPASVTSIGENAFYNSGLTSVTIPNNVTNMGEGAFRECFYLTSVIIGNSVTSIGSYAFSDCSGLTSITVPNSVTSIGSYAFYDCSSLTSITCEAVTPPTCGTKVFENVNKSIPLYVPAESVARYQTADEWKEFTNVLPIETGVEPVVASTAPKKVLRDGQLIIIRNGVEYNINGIILK